MIASRYPIMEAKVETIWFLSGIPAQDSTTKISSFYVKARAATADKAGKVWSMPRFWVSIHSYKKQPVKNYLGGILDLAWLKLAVAALKAADLEIWLDDFYQHAKRLWKFEFFFSYFLTLKDPRGKGVDLIHWSGDCLPFLTGSYYDHKISWLHP